MVEKFCLNMDYYLEKLSETRSIFVSEADFQLELARLIEMDLENRKTQKIINGYKVLLEYLVIPDDVENKYVRNYIDILVVIDGNLIPIELKYKTKEVTIKDFLFKGDILHTKEQAAENENCYAYIKDIRRIEKVKEIFKDRFIEGYAIFLTNNYRYVEGPKNITCAYAPFSIEENKELVNNKPINWLDNKKRDGFEAITLKQKHTPFHWKKYSSIECSDDKKNFYYLIDKIK